MFLQYTYVYTVVSQKSAHGWSTLQAKEGVGALLTFNHKKAPIYAYSDSLPTNIGQTVMHNGAASLRSSCSNSMQHSERQNTTVGVE